MRAEPSEPAAPAPPGSWRSGGSPRPLPNGELGGERGGAAEVTAGGATVAASEAVTSGAGASTRPARGGTCAIGGEGGTESAEPVSALRPGPAGPS